MPSGGSRQYISSGINPKCRDIEHDLVTCIPDLSRQAFLSSPRQTCHISEIMPAYHLFPPHIYKTTPLPPFSLWGGFLNRRPRKASSVEPLWQGATGVEACMRLINPVCSGWAVAWRLLFFCSDYFRGSCFLSLIFFYSPSDSCLNTLLLM